MTGTAAVTLTSAALVLHIAAVVVAFGPLFVYPVLAGAVRRSDPQALGALHRAQLLVARRIITPALPLTLLAGLYLAARERAFGQAWVIVPMVAIAALMALHRLVLIGGYRRLADQAPDDGPPGERYRALARRLGRAELLAAGLVLFTIFVMAARPF